MTRFDKLTILIILSIYIMGCAMTTTYGGRPKQDVFDPDMYAFTIFYNAYSSSYDIEQKAKEEIKEFMIEEGYSNFECVNVHCPSHILKCTYECKFFK